MHLVGRTRESQEQAAACKGKEGGKEREGYCAGKTVGGMRARWVDGFEVGGGPSLKSTPANVGSRALGEAMRLVRTTKQKDKFGVTTAAAAPDDCRGAARAAFHAALMRGAADAHAQTRTPPLLNRVAVFISQESSFRLKRHRRNLISELPLPPKSREHHRSRITYCTSRLKEAGHAMPPPAAPFECRPKHS